MAQGLRLQDLYKSFGDLRAVAGISFQVSPGEVLALLGPSGCGKSTVLALVAGLERPDQGDVSWDEQSVLDIPPHQRGFGLMFQDYALFPHMNCYENIAFGLRMSHWSETDLRKRVHEMLELVGLPNFEGRDVNTLSGGEQQRVALARSLAPGPRLLMLDEPLGALDRTLRERLLVELHQILRRMRQTAIYVTHDQEEAFALADRVAVINAGKLEQLDTPQAIYAHPATIFVARFLGMTNLFEGLAHRTAGGYVVETAIGAFPLLEPREGKLTVLLRPDSVHLDGSGSVQLEGRLVSCSFRGSTCQAKIDLHGEALTIEFPASVQLPPVGERVVLSFEPAQAVQIFSR